MEDSLITSSAFLVADYSISTNSYSDFALQVSYVGLVLYWKKIVVIVLIYFGNDRLRLRYYSPTMDLRK